MEYLEKVVEVQSQVLQVAPPLERVNRSERIFVGEKVAKETI